MNIVVMSTNTETENEYWLTTTGKEKVDIIIESETNKKDNEKVWIKI